MKTLLKYLIPLLMAAAFWGGGEMPSSVPVGSDESVANVVTFISDASDSQSDLWIPRQISSSAPVRILNGARRTGSMQRNNLEFAKAGKVVNVVICCFIQNKSITTLSSRTEPANLLLSLGRLII